MTINHLYYLAGGCFVCDITAEGILENNPLVLCPMAPDITLSGSRKKLEQTVALSIPLALKALAADDTADTVTVRVCWDDLSPDIQTIASVTTTNGSPTISAPSLAKLQPGDDVAGTGIPASTTVVSVNRSVSPQTAVLSANATASGTITLTADPPVFDATLFIVQIKNTPIEGTNGTRLRTTVEIFPFDGTKAADSDRDGDDELTVADSTSAANMSIEIDIDTFLQNARKNRTNV